MNNLSYVNEKLIEFSKKNPAILAAYIFGSTATKKNRSGSDVDIALMIKQPIPGMIKVEWETALSNALLQDVDLVIFDQVGPLLQHQILKYGKIIYESVTKERIKQEVFARRDFLETRFFFKVLDYQTGAK